MLQTTAPRLDVREQHYWIVGPRVGLRHPMRFALYNESINLLWGDDQPVLEPTSDQRRAWQNHRGLMDVAAERPNISGYTMGTSQLSLGDWDELKKPALFSEEDVFYLRLSLSTYSRARSTTGSRAGAASSLIKRTCALMTAKAQYDHAWLDYQYEIGLGHHRSKKNQTDAGHPEVTSQSLDSRAATAKTTPALTIEWQSVAGGVSTPAPKSPFPLYLWLTDNSDLGWGELYVGVTSLLLRQWQSQTRETVEHVRSVRRERRFVLPPSLFHQHFAALVLGRHCGESARTLRMQLTALANAARPQSARQRAGSWTARGSYNCHG
jgi:hypothetical protein